jgi:hypothetical protein
MGAVRRAFEGVIYGEDLSISLGGPRTVDFSENLRRRRCGSLFALERLEKKGFPSMSNRISRR